MLSRVVFVDKVALIHATLRGCSLSVLSPCQGNKRLRSEFSLTARDRRTQGRIEESPAVCCAEQRQFGSENSGYSGPSSPTLPTNPPFSPVLVCPLGQSISSPKERRRPEAPRKSDTDASSRGWPRHFLRYPDLDCVQWGVL